jgi:hypothetical protein
MQTTLTFLDAVKARHSVPSHYALAKKLGCTHQTVSKYRLRKDFLGDSTAIKVAELLEIDPAIVIASAHAERAKKDDERAAWESIVRRLGGAAALVVVGLFALLAPPPANASPHDNGTLNVYYVKSLIRHIFGTSAAIIRRLTQSARFKISARNADILMASPHR